jgi:hypothetical protein
LDGQVWDTSPTLSGAQNDGFEQEVFLGPDVNHLFVRVLYEGTVPIARLGWMPLMHFIELLESNVPDLDKLDEVCRV